MLTSAISRRQIVLLGVACGPGSSGQGDQYVDLALQPLPAFAVPSDNVIMTCAVGTRYVAGQAPELHTNTIFAAAGMCWCSISTTQSAEALRITASSSQSRAHIHGRGGWPPV